MQQIENVIQQYMEKSITLKEAVDKTIEKIFKNMQYFGIKELDEDDKSDFITVVYTKLEHVIKTYNPEKSSFRTFLRGYIRSYFSSWLKGKCKRQAKSHAVEDYFIEEYEFHAADVEEAYSVDNENREFYSETSKEAKIPKKVRTDLNSHLKKIPESTKVMILALKSASFIKPSHIRKLHEITGIDEEKILSMFLQLQGSLYRKKLLHTQQKEMQNLSYILKRRSLILLEKANKDSFFYNSLKKAVEFHDKRWKANTERLKKSKLLTPSCSEIARVLGLETSVVRRIQKYAQKQMKASHT